MVGCSGLRRALPPVGDPVPFPPIASTTASPSASASASTPTAPPFGVCRCRCRCQGQAGDSNSADDLCSEGTKTIEYDQGYGRTGRDDAAPYAAACRLQALQDRSGLGEGSCVHFIASPYSLMRTLTWASLKAAGERFKPSARYYRFSERCQVKTMGNKA